MIVLDGVVHAAVIVLQVTTIALLRDRLRQKRHTLKRAFVDEGIALAERHAKKSKALSSSDKLREAVGWARERCQEHKIKTDDAELSKLVEIRLGAK